MELGRQPVVVLGMFRSGTSCVATCFSKLGYFFGDASELFPADEFNPGGYYELKELMLLNRRIVASFGMNHYRIEEIPEDWADVPGSLALADEVGALLSSKFSGRQRWGWKEPQASVLMPIYKSVFAKQGVEPLYVICVRNPLDVCASQRSHSPLPHIGERVVGLWLHYTLSALRETRGAERVVMHYDDFLGDPEGHLRQAVALIAGEPPSKQAFAEAVESVRSDWRHSRASADGLDQWPELVRQVYELVVNCSRDGDGLRSGRFDTAIEVLWLRWRQMRELVRSSAMPTGRFVVTWTEEGRPASADAAMVPTGSWQTVTLPIQARPGSILRVDPYQTPCVIWIRNATVGAGEAKIAAVLKPGRTGMLSPVADGWRLVVWGPDPLLVVLPSEPVTQLELELLIQASPASLNEVITALRTNLDAVVQRLHAPRR